MLKLLKELCTLSGPSGNEGSVRDFIISQIDGFCECHTDNIGNIIAFKKGRQTQTKKIMIDAHTDEVGLIITHITEGGFLKFSALGGIDTAVMMFRRVLINGKTWGVISGKPIHLIHRDEGKKLPKADSLYIDIGATSREEAEKIVTLGDTAVICGDFTTCGNKILSKALDDRVGCAALIKLLQEDSEYDFYATFSTQEELGLRGARVAAYTVAPDAAIVLEGTTAADIADVPPERTVCKLGGGAAVSFMDRSTVYDREYYNAALCSGIPCQPKAAATGGNNAGAIHLSGKGVRTVAISAPCRYIHSASSVADTDDINAVFKLAKYMLSYIATND